MGKRKAAETGERHETSHKRQKNHGSQLCAGATADPRLSHPAKCPEMPPGLSKRQRKRWRRKQRKNFGRTSGTHSGPRNSIIESSPGFSPAAKQDAAARAHERPTPVDPSTLHRYSTTRLLTKPQKRWHDYRKPHGGTERDQSTVDLKVHARLAVGTGEDKWQGIAPVADSEQSLRRAESPPSPQSRARQHHFNLVHPKMDEVEGDVPADRKRLAGEVAIYEQNRFTPFNRVGKRVSNPPRATTRVPLGQTWMLGASSRGASTLMNSTRPLLDRQPSGTISNRRTSFGQRVASVPDHTEDADVAASFKRFNVFLRGQNAESSDEESDEDSESDASSVSAPRFSGMDAESLLQQGKGWPDVALHDREPGTALQDNFRADESTNPKISATAFAISGPNSRRANMGIKRQASPPVRAQQTFPESSDLQKHTLRSNANVDTTPYSSVLPFLTDMLHDQCLESSEDLYNTIDELSRDIFSATRPLPACKSPVSPDLKCKRDQERRLMTSVPSDRRVTRSMLTREGHGTVQKAFMPTLGDNVVVCHSVRVSDVQPHPAIELQGMTTTADERLSEFNHSELVKQAAQNDGSDSSLSDLSRTPSPPAEVARKSEIDGVRYRSFEDDVSEASPSHDIMEVDATPAQKKRKMTGMTSKHFTPEPRKLRKRQSAPNLIGVDRDVKIDVHGVDNEQNASHPEIHSNARSTQPVTRKQRKGTGRKSTYFNPTKPALDPDVIDRVDFYNTTAGNRNKTVRRVAAGTSTAPVPPIASDRFGIIQEKLWQEPFWLLIAVTFLNKTTGRAAVPVFWALKKQYGTPEGLAAASQGDLEATIWHLGLQRQRSKRLVKIAQAWIEAPPKQSVRWRTLHYPAKGDGKSYKSSEVIPDDAEDCAGAMEIGHMPGCGPYAWDSWRIFCRDVLRGVALDYNGSGAEVAGFEPEWKRVLPGDKELRACLRWMWLREGWIWNCETGEKRQATDEEMERALHGEMDFADEKEMQFAAKAAGVEIDTPVRGGDGDVLPESGRSEVIAEATRDAATPLESSAEETIVVTPSRKRLRRSARLTA